MHQIMTPVYISYHNYHFPFVYVPLSFASSIDGNYQKNRTCSIHTKEDRYIIWKQHYCLTSTPTLRIGWDMAGYTKNWPIRKPSSELAAMAVIFVIRKFHPRKFHPRKFHPAKIPPSENSTQRKFHPAKILPSENSTQRKFHPAKIRLG